MRTLARGSRSSRRETAMMWRKKGAAGGAAPMPRDKRKEEGSELNSDTHTQMSLTLCRTLKVSLESEKLNIEADSDIQSRVHLYNNDAAYLYYPGDAYFKRGFEIEPIRVQTYKI